MSVFITRVQEVFYSPYALPTTEPENPHSRSHQPL